MYSLLSIACYGLLTASGALAASLPIVDLGYERHQAESEETQIGFYTWSNVRFAQPPVGQLRWQPPQAPLLNRSQIQNGSDRATSCPQARPQWELELSSVFTNNSFYSNFSTAGESEDCLFVDVYVPTNVYKNKDSCKAPVLIWMYGGGFVEGSKVSEGNPPGLIRESGNEMIVVMLNYRLGALGWLAGPSFEADPATSAGEGANSTKQLPGTANVGLLDQRFAFEWVQQYIHLFGGDKDRVTIMGESAGGASVMHHITAYAGGPTGDGKEISIPFQQAIAQSPGWYPVISNKMNEDVYNGFLNDTGCDDLACLRGLSSEEVVAANNLTIYKADYGNYVFNPVPDGSYVPSSPAELLLKGKFARQVRLLLGHNVDEAKYYAPPDINDDSDFADFVSEVFPYAESDAKAYISNVLYPSSMFASQADRVVLLESEFLFTCNTYFMGTAFENQTYNYLFAYDDAYHGADVPYTFYDPTAGPSDTDAQVATQLQQYITSFVLNGKPAAKNEPPFPIYGQNATVRVINSTGPVDILDPTANSRCDWWQLGIYM